MRNILLKLAVSFLLLFIVCPVSFADQRLAVFVSIAPQKYFVQQIGKDLVNVQVLVEPGASPHTYEPKPRQMADLSKTQLYFAIGVEFEKAWLPRIAATNPQMQIVHTDQGLPKLPMTAHHHEGHHHERHQQHGQDKHHHHHGDGLDPHVWLSPTLVMQQARTIVTALQQADPVHRKVYEANYKQFMATLIDLDAELRALFADHRGMSFMVFHPAWGYFAYAYGLHQIPVEVEGKDPKPAQLQALIEQARHAGITVIFVQPQFSTRSAEIVARDIGGQVVFANPLAEDWLENLQTVAAKFRAVLR